MVIYYSFIVLTVFITTSAANIIGDSCRYDSDCFVEHSFCLHQEICECKENYLVSNDQRYCIAMVGAICDSKHDCSSLANSICYEENCLCDRGFVPDPHNLNCKPVASGLQAPCEYDNQCYPTMGQHSTCRFGQCTCMPGYMFVGKCIQTKNLGENCISDRECYRNSTFYKNSTACINNRCKCKPGFHQTSTGDCVNTGISTRFERVLTVLTLIITMFNVYEKKIFL